MKYESATEYIRGLEVFGSRPGLERISELMSRLNAPAPLPEYIHVAGTNGKGSVSVMLSEIFRRAGYKTGLTVSPFVLDFRERIQINGEMISPEALAAETEKLCKIIPEMPESVTEFEFITALALDYFAEQGCEFAVIETGLGGRFDATNVIPKNRVAVITSISLDHTQILGDTIEQIAAEKCGIIKSGGAVVTYPLQRSEAAGVIKKSAKALECPLIIPNISELIVISEDITGSEFSYKGKNYFVGMPGRHQIYNAVTAIEAALAAGAGFDTIRAGISSARLPARIEIIRKNPLLILDGAHNPDGAMALKNALDLYLPDEKAVFIIGMLRDKDVKQVLNILSPKISEIVAVSTPVAARALSAEELRRKAKELDIAAVPAESYQQALDLAAKKAKGGAVIICGSLYLAAELRPLLKQHGEGSFI